MSAPEANLALILHGHAASTPTRPALCDGAGEVSYGALSRACDAMAARLWKHGLRPGHRVLLAVPMSVDLYVALIGCWQVGAVVVLVEPGLDRPALRSALERARPSALIGVPLALAWALTLPELRHVRHRLAVTGRSSLEHDGRRHAAFPVASEAPALLTFTSGTTGPPKGIVRSHAFLWGQHRAVQRALGTAPMDRELLGLPVFVLSTLASGATAVLCPVSARVDATPLDDVLRLALQQRITTVSTSPALALRLAARLGATHTRLRGVTTVNVGGAPVAPSDVARLSAAFPDAVVRVVYGSTEAEPISHVEGFDAASTEATRHGAGLCVGAPVDAVALRLAQNGEILVSGAHVNGAYLDDPEAERHHKVIDEDGTRWHRTGDVGRVDGTGRLWLLGRLEQVIVRGGQVLHPLAVEMAAREALGLQRTALVEHRDRITLVVEGRTDLGRARQVHASIERVVTVEAIPVDVRHNGKVDVRRLRALLDASA